MKARAVTLYFPGFNPSIVNWESRESFCLITLPLLSAKQERVLKLLGKRAAAGGRDVEQQTVLRIFEIQARAQFFRLVHALADDAGWRKRWLHPPRRVAHYASVCSDQQERIAIVIAFWQDGENILRRQALLGIQLRNYWSMRLVKQDLY